MDFNTKDLLQIREKGISVEAVSKQIENFINGFPFARLISAATRESGILHITPKDMEDYLSLYESQIENHKVLKFIPASGAATRMFKDLYEFTAKYMGLKYTLKEYPSVQKTIENLTRFAFYDELKSCFVKHGVVLEEYLESGEYTTVVNYILNDIGLNYASYPKAWIAFHRYDNEIRTSLEEHFVEAIDYLKQKDDSLNMHFTVSQEHINEFKSRVDKIINKYSKSYNLRYNVSFSIQKPSTDTVAVKEDNTLAYDKNGDIIFRPSGHGALIENLNDCRGDIIFIKNIDNVANDALKKRTSVYKKLIGGVLLSYQERVFSALKSLERGTLNAQEVTNIIILCNELGIELNDSEKQSSDIMRILFDRLNRPIRVCGMVKNVGEPGGGPFWIDRKGIKSLQIVESAQVDMNDEAQRQIFMSSTHFNPVDLVCGVKNYNGDNFDLTKYVDYQSGFISIKSKDGENIKAQELPGLWNGAMADWITIFVDVPLQTFTPVKVLNDLLREEHQ